MKTTQSYAKEIGIGTSYWLSPAFFLLAAIGTLIFILLDKTQRSPLMFTCMTFFASISIAGMLFGVLRLREPREPLERKKTENGKNISTIFFPFSTAKQWTISIGGIFFGIIIAVLTPVLFLEGHSLKALLLPFASIMCFIGGIRALRQQIQLHRKNINLGLSLAPTGLVWHEMFRDEILIPWEQIQDFGIGKIDQSTSPQFRLAEGLTFWLCLKDVQSMDVLEKQKEHLKHRYGHTKCHFVLTSENLSAPLSMLVECLQYYKNHPDQREIPLTTFLEKALREPLLEEKHDATP
jgi:hypothetical protein